MSICVTRTSWLVGITVCAVIVVSAGPTMGTVCSTAGEVHTPCNPLLGTQHDPHTHEDSHGPECNCDDEEQDIEFEVEIDWCDSKSRMCVEVEEDEWDCVDGSEAGYDIKDDIETVQPDTCKTWKVVYTFASYTCTDAEHSPCDSSCSEYKYIEVYQGYVAGYTTTCSSNCCP